MYGVVVQTFGQPLNVGPRAAATAAVAAIAMLRRQLLQIRSTAACAQPPQPRPLGAAAAGIVPLNSRSGATCTGNVNSSFNSKCLVLMAAFPCAQAPPLLYPAPVADAFAGAATPPAGNECNANSFVCALQQ